MIIILIKFILGFMVGSIAVFLLVYTLGSVLEMMGVILYDSESDQQRNFNIVMIAWLMLSTLAGYIATKFVKKANK